MRVSFDSNAWEAVFGPEGSKYTPVRSALLTGRVDGFVCEIAFRIEAIKKQFRSNYFASPKMNIVFPGGVLEVDGKKHLHLMSIGPDDRQHPGLPDIQAERWRVARAAGVLLLRGLAWMGLPAPQEVRNPEDFVPEDAAGRNEREQRQVTVNTEIWERGVGKKVFDDAGGWKVLERGDLHSKNFIKACAEWADGELVAAHIAYGNDVLCTNDHARAARQSIFSEANRSWLTSAYGVKFATVEELVGMAKF